jgi:hypothetical protein
MHEESRYQYGPRVLRLTMIVLVAVLTACFFFYLWLFPDEPKGPLDMPPIHERQPLRFWGALLIIIGVALYHGYLLIRRFAAPQFVTIDPVKLVAPTSEWKSAPQVSNFKEVQQIIGPRAGKLEVRCTNQSVLLDAARFRSHEEFQECCQQILRRCGIRRASAVQQRISPKYVQIAEKFSTVRFSEYFGAVVASADALFLIRLKNYQQRYKGLSEGISHAFERLGGKEQIEMPISGLPASILDDDDWPLWDREGTVRVVPKNAVLTARFPWWGAFTFRTDGYVFKVSVPFWKAYRVRRQLRHMGWTD